MTEKRKDMNNPPLKYLLEQVKHVREGYHRLAIQHHGLHWTAEEDALALLSDAGLVGCLIMAR